MIISTVVKTKLSGSSNLKIWSKLSGSYCFYNTIKEQYLAMEGGAYVLRDLSGDTMITSGMVEEIPDTVKNMMKENIFGPMSNFVVVPINSIDWNEHGILTPDFTQAVDANGW